MNYYKMKYLLAALTFSPFTFATNVDDDGKYLWTFLSGSPWPTGYNRNIGKPDNLIWARGEYDADFFERISNALPESEVNEAFMTDNDGANLTLVDEAEVFVTFIHIRTSHFAKTLYFFYFANR